MKEIYIRYPVIKKIEVDDEIYDMIDKDIRGECVTIDEVDYKEYLWKKVIELTDDEYLSEVDFWRRHDGFPVADFCY